MRTIVVDGRYLRFVEAQMMLVGAQIGRDVRRRANGDPPTIPDTFLDTKKHESVLLVAGHISALEKAGRIPARRRNKLKRKATV